MIGTFLQRACVLFSLPLAACVATPASVSPAAPVPAEKITMSVGPCFGSCPVYKVSISSAGTVIFNGERDTAVLGEMTRSADAETYRRIARQLAPFRPVDGAQTAVECSAAVSDTSTLTVSWTDVTGHDATATIASGCPSGPGRDLVNILTALPTQLGIAEWTKETTRPGDSRG